MSASLEMVFDSGTEPAKVYPGWMLASSSALLRTLQVLSALFGSQTGSADPYLRYGLACACQICLMTRVWKLDLGNFVEQYTACIAFLLVQQRALYTSCNGASNLRPNPGVAGCRMAFQQASERYRAEQHQTVADSVGLCRNGSGFLRYTRRCSCNHTQSSVEGPGTGSTSCRAP